MLQRELLESLGGRDPADVMTKCITKQIQRPQLCQTFNCGGAVKAGSLLTDAVEKHNFIGTQCAECIKRMYPNYLVDIKYFRHVRTIKCCKVYETVTKS